MHGRVITCIAYSTKYGELELNEIFERGELVWDEDFQINVFLQNV